MLMADLIPTGETKFFGTIKKKIKYFQKTFKTQKKHIQKQYNNHQNQKLYHISQHIKQKQQWKLIINKNTLIVHQARYNKSYFYPTKTSYFLDILEKIAKKFHGFNLHNLDYFSAYLRTCKQVTMEAGDGFWRVDAARCMYARTDGRLDLVFQQAVVQSPLDLAPGYIIPCFQCVLEKMAKS